MYLFILLCVFVIINFVLSSTKSDYAEVFEEIFQTNKYNKKVLPQEDSDEPLEVHISFQLFGIEIDEVVEKMVTTGYLAVSWHDLGLAWDPSNHNQVENVYVPQDDAWKPDIFLQNGFKKLVDLGTPSYYISVDHNGWTTWVPFEVFETSCSLDTTFFPFDEQNCNVSIVIWSHTLNEIILVEAEDAIIFNVLFQENSVWDIISLTSYVSDDSTEPKITYTIKLKRKPLYYVFNILLPVEFLGFLNGLVFVIPADTGEKMGFSMTVFLSLAVFLTSISEALPVNSVNVSVLGVYLLLQVIIGVCVLITSALQLRLNARNTSLVVSGAYLRIVQMRTKCCGRQVRMKACPDDVSITNMETTLTDFSWDQVVSAIDLFGFSFIIIVYTIMSLVMLAILIIQWST
ncbi:hypothetical protein FSP39_013223 [Pinctada imbricata]|uniref:Uncharacterized protein n=1 Tax=Pinctada imbricata TaxID=66713 RepID=A0AA88XUJ5_PINIB|nr:hypothetical protein FSP39_013223 [Pinctada imbricata]